MVLEAIRSISEIDEAEVDVIYVEFAESGCAVGAWPGIQALTTDAKVHVFDVADKVVVIFVLSLVPCLDLDDQSADGDCEAAVPHFYDIGFEAWSSSFTTLINFMGTNANIREVKWPLIISVPFYWYVTVIISKQHHLQRILEQARERGRRSVERKGRRWPWPSLCLSRGGESECNQKEAKSQTRRHLHYFFFFTNEILLINLILDNQ